MSSLTAMMFGVAAVSQAAAARTLLVEQTNCGYLGQEWCEDESCKEDFLPVNLGGASTICRTPEEANASGGIVGDGNGNGTGDSGDGDGDGGDGDNINSSPCGGEEQTVCSGDQMSGRDFECDFGFVADKTGTCVLYEDNITSTPTAEATTEENMGNSATIQALTGDGDGDGNNNNNNNNNDTPDIASSPADDTPAAGGGGTGTATGAAQSGHITHFTAMGTPHGGCGVPADRATDDNDVALPFLALNTNSLFENGANCGRWIEITLEENCDGGSNDVWSICNGGNGFQDDDYSGDVIYGYVLDSCADQNFWCQNDNGHLDLSTDYLQGLGLIGEHFNARMSSWTFLDGAPQGWTMNTLKFQYMEGAQWLPDGFGFHLPLVIYNTDDGITSVELLDTDGTWLPAAQLTNLGNVWDLPEPSDMRDPNTRDVTVRITGHSGESYGESVIPWPCGTTVCGSTMDVTPN